MAIKSILKAIDNFRDYTREGYLIVNRIGLTLYLAYDKLTSKELFAIAQHKKEEE